MAVALRTYITDFRIKELQQCLEQLGLSKRGRKLELQNRLLTYIGECQALPHNSGNAASAVWKADAAERVITKIWKQMHGVPDSNVADPSTQRDPYDSVRERIESGAEASSSHAYAAPAWGATNHNEHSHPYIDNVQGKLVGRNNTEIRCICANNEDRGTMVQCEGESCGVWQHCNCVAIDSAAMPEHFFCQSCRIALADPFWQADGTQLIPPALLRVEPGRPVTISATGKEKSLAASRGFFLSPTQLEPLRKNSQTEQLHVACLLLDDTVPNRIHWPRQAELKINGMVYRPYGRNSNTKLGANARDEFANAAHRCSPGNNRISLHCAEDRQFVLMAYTVRSRSVEDVKKMMAPAEDPATAVSRVASTMRGSKTGQDDDDDDDLLISNTVISLKDPLSCTRIQKAARFAGLPGIVAFDLDCFLSMAQRSRKWQDPHTLRNVTVKQLQLDTWMQAIIDRLQGLPDVTEVEVNADGCWRPTGSDMRFQSTTADTGPLIMSQVQVKPDPGQAADDDSEEESEGEELRKAATAYTAASRQIKPSQPEVIVLDDSSDDDQPSARPSQPRARAAGSTSTVASILSSANASNKATSQPSNASSGVAKPQQSAFCQPGHVPPRQMPASLQRSADSSQERLRIRLTNRPSQQQRMTNGVTNQPTHPADPTSSAQRLAAAAAAARSPHQPSSHPGGGPEGQSHLGKRKHLELDGQYGAYSQAAAQAAGMSMHDRMQHLTHRSSGNSNGRLPPYPDTSVSYSSRNASSHMPYNTSKPQHVPQPQPKSPDHWQQLLRHQHQQHQQQQKQQQQVGSPAYGQTGEAVPSRLSRPSMPTSPPYSPHAEVPYASSSMAAPYADATLNGIHQQPSYGAAPSSWQANPLTDGHL